MFRGVPSREENEPKPPNKILCLPIPDHVYHRADPMIYDQYYLMAQGLAVTWDNPDITIEQGGMIVPSHELKPSTVYDVIARIWNGSIDGIAVNMPVRFSYLSFGIGIQSHPIGETVVNLPVKGAPGCPTFAHMSWTTPAQPGHYCIQVQLIWSDDANPNNNLGQDNTDVQPLHSPATFSFPLRNNDRLEQKIELQVDAYAIPPQRNCDGEKTADSTRMGRAEIAEHIKIARARNDRNGFPIPDGWNVQISPSAALVLGPGEQRDVNISITAPNGFSGTKAFNVNAFARTKLIGGLTLCVTG